MTHIDFLVIGAGISGASAAAELAASGSVLLVETEALAGYHSTGRSAALYTPNFGSPLVRRLNAAGHGFFTAPPDGFATTPLLTPRAALTIARPGEEVALEAVLAMSTPTHPIHRIPVAEALRLAPVLRPEVVGVAALEPGVTDMDVAAIHQGFLGLFRRRGGVIRLNAPVTALARDGRGWRATVGGETVLAGVVVNAAGAWGDDLARMAGAPALGLVAKRRTMIAVEAPVFAGASEMPLVEFAGEEAYFKPDAGRILASPGDETPVAPQDVQPEEWDIAVIADWLHRHTTLDVRRVPNAWAGLRSFVADHAPVVGFDPDCPGFFWLIGQGGYGIMLSPTLARITGSLATGGALPADIAAAGISTAELAPERLRPAKSSQAKARIRA